MRLFRRKKEPVLKIGDVVRIDKYSLMLVSFTIGSEGASAQLLDLRHFKADGEANHDAG